MRGLFQRKELPAEASPCPQPPLRSSNYLWAGGPAEGPATRLGSCLEGGWVVVAAGETSSSSPQIPDGKPGPREGNSLAWGHTASEREGLGWTQERLDPRKVRGGRKTARACLKHQPCARHLTPTVFLNQTDLCQLTLTCQIWGLRRVNSLL